MWLGLDSSWAAAFDSPSIDEDLRVLWFAGAASNGAERSGRSGEAAGKIVLNQLVSRGAGWPRLVEQSHLLGLEQSAA